MINEKLYYEEESLPAGLLFLGDSIQRLNPIYGQGITLCAQGAVELLKTLDKVDMSDQKDVAIEKITVKYRQNLTKKLQQSWRLTTASDLR